MDSDQVQTGPIDPKTPVRVAWDRYKATDAYANTLNWATQEEHTEGSLWAAFYQGWMRYPGEEAQVTKLAARVAELEASNVEKDERLSDFIESYQKVIGEECSPDERHCTCVPSLRTRIAELEGALNGASRLILVGGPNGDHSFDEGVAWHRRASDWYRVYTALIESEAAR